MNKSTKIRIVSILLFTMGFFLSVILLNSEQTKDNTIEHGPIQYTSSSDYIYIDKYYNLKSFDELKRTYTIIDTSISEFKSSKNMIAYIKDTPNGKYIYSLNLATNNSKNLGFIGNNDYIPYKNYIFLVENSSIIAIDTETNQKVHILNVKTNDIVLADVTDSSILFSRKNELHNETIIYNFEIKKEQLIGTQLFSNHINDNVIWGVNQDNHIYRFKDETLSIIPNLKVIKLKVINNTIFYINEYGDLCIFNNGVEKKLAFNVLDFYVSDTENLFYISQSNNNSINKLKSNSSNKTLLFDDALNTLYIHEL